jgi:hypothetical protein
MLVRKALLMIPLRGSEWIRKRNWSFKTCKKHESWLGNRPKNLNQVWINEKDYSMYTDRKCPSEWMRSTGVGPKWLATMIHIVCVMLVTQYLLELTWTFAECWRDAPYDNQIQIGQSAMQSRKEALLEQMDPSMLIIALKFWWSKQWLTDLD